MPIARELMREGTHVAGALHIVLTAQGVDAHAFAADVAGGHGQIGNSHHHGGALAVFGHSQAVVNGAVSGAGVHPCGGANVGGGHARNGFHRFG